MSGRDPTAAEVRKFTLAARALAELGAAGLYLANDTLHLMSGESHDVIGAGELRPRTDRIRASAQISGAGGGDW